MSLSLSLLLLQVAGSLSHLASHSRSRRATPTSSAVLLYSTHDSIYELPFKSLSQTINGSDFRRIFSSASYIITAFSATYSPGDNMLFYGKTSVRFRPLRSGPSYLFGDDRPLPILFTDSFTVDWLDYNVYALEKRRIVLYGLHTHSHKVVSRNFQSARNLLVGQGSHFVAWIANEVNIVKMNKDGTDETTIWTEPYRPILCMTFDPERLRFYFFVNEQSTQLDTSPSKSAIYYSIASDASEWSPIREGSLPYRRPGGTLLHVVKYYEQTFVVLKLANEAGNEVYQLAALRKTGNRLLESIVKSTSWPLTGLYLAWTYPDPPKQCHKEHSRCVYLCAHLYDDSTAMCLCPEGAYASCVRYKMTERPPPTRAPVTPQQGKGPSALWNPRGNTDAGTWLLVILLLIVVLAALYLLYLYSNDDDEEGQEGQGSTPVTEGSQTIQDEAQAPAPFTWWKFFFGTNYSSVDDGQPEEGVFAQKGKSTTPSTSAHASSVSRTKTKTKTKTTPKTKKKKTASSEVDEEVKNSAKRSKKKAKKKTRGAEGDESSLKSPKPRSKTRSKKKTKDAAEESESEQRVSPSVAKKKRKKKQKGESSRSVKASIEFEYLKTPTRHRSHGRDIHITVPSSSSGQVSASPKTGHQAVLAKKLCSILQLDESKEEKPKTRDGGRSKSRRKK